MVAEWNTWKPVPHGSEPQTGSTDPKHTGKTCRVVPYKPSAHSAKTYFCFIFIFIYQHFSKDVDKDFFQFSFRKLVPCFFSEATFNFKLILSYF